MKACDNADSDNRAAATIELANNLPHRHPVRVLFGRSKPLENGVFGSYETIAVRSQALLS
jgi:hypothetical protein